MDLTLSEEQELIKASVREFLENECSMDLVKAAQEGAPGYSQELWQEMAQLGYMGIPFPEAYGGMGSGFVELCVLIEEHGRFQVPIPFFSTVVVCGLPIARFGTEDQKSEYLTAIASGETIMTYAQTEQSATSRPSDVQLTATADDDGYRLDGASLLVSYADVADVMLVAAPTSREDEREPTLFLVDAKSAGITCERLKTIDCEPQYKVTFSGVHVPESNILGQRDEGRAIVQAIREWGAAARCAEMVGGAQRVLEMSIDYAKTRVQFDRPIGSFQAVQHHCANMAVDVEGSRFIAYEAIWRLSEELDASKEVSMAKAWVSDAYQRVCALGHQIHGAIGFTMEHDMYIFFRHAKACELSFGDGDYHREMVAQQLGL